MGKGSLPCMSAPGYRTFAAEVSRVHRLCPSFVRLTFSGDDLLGFGASGADQRLKLVLPAPGTTAEELVATCRRWGDDWYPQWLRTPVEQRPLLRTYTVRAARPSRGEVDVDVVLHGDGAGAGTGPASRWAARAAVGDSLVLVGPDQPGQGRAWGREWAPPPGGRLLLAGDETAVPAVCAVLEALEPEAARRTVALLEVPCAEDALQPVASGGAQVRWLPRRSATGTAPRGSLLCDAVRALLASGTGGAGGLVTRDGVLSEPFREPDVDTELLWEVPTAVGDGELYAWVAGEAAVVRDLRRHLVREAGLPRTSLAAMGYWRAGRSEAA